MTVDAPHAGALLVELRETMRTIPELPDGLRPGTFEEAYAIQDELQRQGGWGTGALKVGCTSEFAQQALGIDSPVVGVVADSMTFGAGATIDRSLFHHDPLLEGEFAVRLAVDVDGNRYLDLTAGFGVAAVRHAHPKVVDAISRQLATLNTHTRYLHENILDYAERLTGKQEMGRTCSLGRGFREWAGPGGERISVSLRSSEQAQSGE